MAKGQLIILISSLLFLALAFPSISAYPEAPAKAAKEVEVVIETMVYCQSCKYFGSWSLTGAKPLPGAKVSVTCKNHKGHVSFYKAYEADKNGYVYAVLKGFKMFEEYFDHPLQACKVKLVGSPNERCNLLSNINKGISGAPLRYKNKRIVSEKYEAVIYTPGPLAFRPNHCYSPTHY